MGSQPGVRRVGLPDITGIDWSSYSRWQLHFLVRLAGLARQHRELQRLLDPGDWRLRLVRKALYATYQDCVGQGVQWEAQLVLEEEAGLRP